MHTAVKMAHKYASEHGKEEVTLPEEFKHHTALFSDEEANKFPPACRDGDHKIVLMDTAPIRFNCKVYPLSRDEQEAENKFIDENLEKATSHHQTPPMASPPSWSLKRTQRRRDILSTIALSTQSPKKTLPHSPTSNNASRTCKEWNYSASSTSAGATITSVYGKEINGRPHSKHVKDYSNPK